MFKPDAKRILLLCKNEILQTYKNIPTIVVFTGIVLAVISFFVGPREESNWWGFIYMTLLMGGYIVSAYAFRDLHSKNKGMHYLMIPASISEKLISKLLFTSIGYVLICMILLFVFSALASIIHFFVYKEALVLFNPIDSDLLYFSLKYLVTQSIFVLGSLYFKKFSLLKTIISAVVIAVLVIVFSTYLSSYIVYYLTAAPGDGFLVRYVFNFLSSSTVNTVFWVIVPALAITVSYFRLKEFEV